MRSLTLIISVFCIATLLTEGLVVGFLWARGQLTPENVQEIAAVLSGEERPEPDLVAAEEQLKSSNAEIERKRVFEILQLSTRQKELELLKDGLEQNRDIIMANQDAFNREKEAFIKQLDDRLKAVESESMEQARNVLLAMNEADAVKQLMEIDLEDNVELLKGMPEKKIAGLLEAFNQGDIKEFQRGLDIFQAITNGNPTAKDIQDRIDGLTTSDADTP